MTAPGTIPGRLVQVVYNKVLADDLSDPLVAALKEAGIDLRAISESYARQTWYRGIELAGAALYGSDAPEQQRHKLGRHLIECLQTRQLIRGPWLSMAKLMGPRRALRQAADFGATSSPVHFHIIDKGSRELEVVVEDDQQLEFLTGMLESLVQILGGRDPKVSVRSVAAARATFSLSWR